MKINALFLSALAFVLFSQEASRAAEASVTAVTYQAYRFKASEGWRAIGAADWGATKLEAQTWHFDFSKGAPWLGVTLPDRSLFTRPERFRLRVRGEAAGHPVYISLRTHFMTFDKVVGELSGKGDQELAFAAPPGEGWAWHGGENDGKIHGPLRLGEIRLESNGHHDRGTLELLSFEVEGSCPADKLAVLSASHVATNDFGVFRASLQWLGKTNASGTLECSVRDWNRHELTLSRRPITLKPGEAQVLDFPVLLPTGTNVRFLEAEFRLEMPGQLVNPVQAYWLAPLPPQTNVELRPESPFGMGVYLGRFSPETMEELARKARDAGVKWSREDFGWQRIEPRPGEYHWEFYDHLVDCARRNGISVYAIVGYWTEWSKSYTPEGVDQYAAYVRQLVRRYKDRIHQWEIWNEPNIFFWQGPKELYAELLKKSYSVIKEEDATAQVLGISTAGIDFKFIEKMQQLGAPFDVLTIHPYRSKFDDQAFIADLKKVSDQVKLPDGTRRPVWLTEMGWATHVPHHVLGQDFQPFTQRTQAELIARVYLCSIVSGIEPRTFWYDFRNDGNDAFYFEHNMGILRQDGTPKPAYVAYATLARALEGLKFAEPVQVPQGTFGFRFSNAEGNKQAVALWNPNATAEVRLPVPAGSVKLVNTVGEETVPPLAEDSTDRSLTVHLQPGAVVYVCSEKKR